jgi:hypothetical protein
VAIEWGAAEAAQCAASHSVYQMIDVERNVGSLPVKADLVVETHFSHQEKIRSEGLADAVAGVSFVAAEFGATLPLVFEASRWLSSEVAADVVVSVAGSSRCLCFVGLQRKD